MSIQSHGEIIMSDKAFIIVSDSILFVKTKKKNALKQSVFIELEPKAEMKI